MLRKLTSASFVLLAVGSACGSEHSRSSSLPNEAGAGQGGGRTGHGGASGADGGGSIEGGAGSDGGASGSGGDDGTTAGTGTRPTGGTGNGAGSPDGGGDDGGSPSGGSSGAGGSARGGSSGFGGLAGGGAGAGGSVAGAGVGGQGGSGGSAGSGGSVGSDYEGRWSGLTEQDKPIEFEILGGGLMSFEYDWQLPICASTTVVSLPAPAPIVGNHTDYSFQASAGMSSLIGIDFESEALASGMLTYTYRTPGPNNPPMCNGTRTVGFTATKMR